MPVNYQYYDQRPRATSSSLDLNRESILLDIASRVATNNSSLRETFNNVVPNIDIGDNSNLINTGLRQLSQDPRYTLNEKVRSTDVTDTDLPVRAEDGARAAGRRALELAELELESGGGFQPIAEQSDFGIRIPNPTNAQRLGRNEGALGFNDLTRVGLDATQIDETGALSRAYLRDILASI